MLDPTLWNTFRHRILRWLPYLRHRAVVVTFIFYSIICLILNYFVQTTFEENTTFAEREHIEQIARFYYNNPLIDRYGLMAEGHSLWEAAGRTFPTLHSINLVDAQGMPLACFNRIPSASTVFKAGTNCSKITPPSPGTSERLWEHHPTFDILWQVFDTPSHPSSWLRLEVRHASSQTGHFFFLTPLLTAEAILGAILLAIVYTVAFYLEQHINALSQRLRLFDYSGFKDTSRPVITRLPWVLSDIEWALHGVLDRVKKEVTRLQQSEARLNDLIKTLPGTIIHHSLEGNILFLSPSPLTSTLLTDISSSPQQLQTIAQLIQATDINHYHSHVKAILEDPLLPITCRVALRNHPQRFLEFHLARYVDAAGNNTILTYVYECSAMLKHEQALVQENHQYRQWLEYLPLPIYIKNQLGQYLFFNHAWEELTQISRQQWMGKTAWDVFEPSHAQTLWDRERETFDRMTTTAYETDIRNQSGQTHRALIYRAPLLENEQPIGMIGLIVSLDGDIHHADLQTRLERAEHQDRQHTQMLAHLSDRIRTHLHSLLGLVDLMNAWLKTLALPHNSEYLGLIHTLAYSVLDTTTDVNDILSFEQRTALPQPCPFNLEAVLIECARHYSPLAESKQLELIVNLEPSLPNQVEGDAQLLRRAFDTLVHNAIKFTPNGSVEISASLIHLACDQVWIRFSVSDTGIGIPDDQHQYVFEPFVQGDAVLSRQHHGGSGLGLTVFSRLMQHLGATYQIESQPGKGTTISFDWALPYIQQPDPSDINELYQHTLLIVEDHARTSQVITQLATSWSMRALSARTAHQAISILNEHTSPNHLGIYAILIDGRLSDEDRSAAARVLEAAHTAGIRHRIMMLPVNAPFREHERYRQAHATDILLKPLHRQELLRALLNTAHPVSSESEIHYIGIPETPQEELLSKTPPSSHPRILLATHDPINRKLVEGWLEQLGHRCITVSNGEELMSYYTAERFAAIFIDLDMTRPSGTELLRLISLQSRILAHNTPIITMTSGKHGEHLIPSDAPVWNHIQKPAQLHALSAMLNSLPSSSAVPSAGNPPESGTRSGDTE